MASLPASLQSPYAPLGRPPSSTRPLHIVLACSGSVASIKVPLILESLLTYANVRVQVIATRSALHFVSPSALRLAGAGSGAGYSVSDLAKENQRAAQPQPGAPRAHLWTDDDEWNQWARVGEPILHIELRRWADVVLVAPCSANTLAKINAGICDSLLTCFLRALSPSTPTLLFPAMNTLMYLHPLTERHIAFAKHTLGYHIFGPIEKRLACGDLGPGAMYEWSDIVKLVVERYALVPNQQQ